MVAEELRRRIEAGAIPAGALLPPESALVQEFGISRGTAREAIAALRAEGLVVTEHGRGTYARPKLPVRRLRYGRYHLEATPGAGEQVAAQHQEVPANSELAELFGVSPGTILLRRRLLVSVHGVPQQLVTSHQPVATADSPSLETDLTSEEAAGPLILEIVRARMPTAEESNDLRVPAGIPVITITQHKYVTEHFVDVAKDIVLPADRTELEYEIPRLLGTRARDSRGRP